MHKVRKSRLPALVAAAVAMGVLAGPSLAAVGQIRTQPNYRMGFEQQVPRADDGVGLAVNPNDRDHIVSVNIDYLKFACEYRVSFDGGRTWSAAREFRAPAGYPVGACSPIGHGNSAFEGSVQFGQGQNVYATFATVPVEGDESARPGQSVIVAKSTNGGRTFATGVVALAGSADRRVAPCGPDYRFPELVVQPGSNGSDDKVWVTAAANYSTQTGGDECTAQDRVAMSVSDDGGATWGDPSFASPDGERALEPSQPVRLGDAIYIAWRRRGFDAFIVVAKTEDDGQNWTWVDAVPVQGFDSNGPDTPGGQFTASSFPRMAADPASGNLYLVYGQGPLPGGGYPGITADHFMHPDMDVLFIKSTDGGANWTEPKVINDPPVEDDEITQTRHANISVARNGRIDVVWHDRRHWYQDEYRPCTNTHSPPAGGAPCNEARFGDTYYAYSENDGEDWSADRRISDRTQNLDVGYDYRFGAYWDFGPVSVPQGNRSILVAWGDSRLGNFDTDNHDIWLGRVNLNSDSGPQVSRIERNGTVGLSVALSRFAYPAGYEATLASTFATQAYSRVVIVHRRDAAAALAAGVLGRAKLGPVLLANGNGLPASVMAEIERLTPVGAYVVGSESKLGRGVIADLVLAGVPHREIDRLPGTVFERAAAIADALDDRTADQKAADAPAFDAALIVNPRSAIGPAAAALAAHRRLPILFADQSAPLPDATEAALDRLDVQEAIVVGGTGAVGDDVVAELEAAPLSLETSRLGNDSAAATSGEVVQESVERGMPLNVLFVADSERRMDSALLGAVIGRVGGLHILRGNASLRSARRAMSNLDLLDELDRIIRVTSA